MRKPRWSTAPPACTIIFRVLLPLGAARPAAFAIVSVTAHWNEFLWPLMATSSPSTQVLTVGLASFTSGAEAGSEWGVIAAGTFFVAAPLLVLFVLFQRQFVASFTYPESNRGELPHASAITPPPRWRSRCPSPRRRHAATEHRYVLPGAGARQAGGRDADA